MKYRFTHIPSTRSLPKAGRIARRENASFGTTGRCIAMPVQFGRDLVFCVLEEV